MTLWVVGATLWDKSPRAAIPIYTGEFHERFEDTMYTYPSDGTIITRCISKCKKHAD